MVRVPGRRFPGVLIQSGSLHILRSDVAGVLQACERGDLAEAAESAGIVLASLDTLLTRCSTGLERHEIQRQYRVDE
ncbi:DUF6959 family protein [Streptomyces sp. Marseille-Q5077]|uniref:DUF6959 family protein n=1 Tax=Streptomyces sp. Marseille-Q5077 TaxID=3418995 RepID=UPI003CFBDDB1